MEVPPNVTVLMPVFNCAMYIREAVESILNQTYTNFEFLIIDDASTDETVSILKSYTDSRIQLIEKPFNTGLTNSLNQGLRIAKGKYIARMDGDDISLPERFDKQVSFLESHPEVVLCGSWFSIIGSDWVKKLPEHHDDIQLTLLRRNCIAHPSVMIRKHILDKFDVFYEVSKEPTEDYALWVRLSSLGKLHNLQDPLLNYRVHTSQVSSKRVEERKIKEIETKFELLHFLGVVWDAEEYGILEKFFKENTIIHFKEIKLFKQIQKKLLVANTKVHFFEPIGFKHYLSEMEFIVLKKCFYKQKRHSPLMYLEYLMAKLKWNVGVTTEMEIKFGIKSMLFWKVTEI
jgi:glycosyltransferase involved in cell wall biosynthesis